GPAVPADRESAGTAGPTPDPTPRSYDFGGAASGAPAARRSGFVPGGFPAVESEQGRTRPLGGRLMTQDSRGDAPSSSRREVLRRAVGGAAGLGIWAWHGPQAFGRIGGDEAGDSRELI